MLVPGRIAAESEPKLDDKQRQQVRRWITGQGPRRYGFDYGLWSRKIVQALIQERMAIELGVDRRGSIVGQLGYSPPETPAPSL